MTGFESSIRKACDRWQRGAVSEQGFREQIFNAKNALDMTQRNIAMKDLTDVQAALVQGLRETIVALNILQRQLKNEGLEVDISCYSGGATPDYCTARIYRDVREIDIEISRDGK